jgi:hypothetical protein
MTDDASFEGLHIDSDWKTEAAREKEKLAAQERQAEAKTAPEGGDPGGAFVELINLIAMQAAVALGGLQGPGGERIPANPISARHFIDMLEVLQARTKGNLSADEQRLLESILYELRMSYVHVFAPPSAPAPAPGKKP